LGERSAGGSRRQELNSRRVRRPHVPPAPRSSFARGKIAREQPLAVAPARYACDTHCHLRRYLLRRSSTTILSPRKLNHAPASSAAAAGQVPYAPRSHRPGAIVPPTKLPQGWRESPCRRSHPTPRSNSSATGRSTDTAPRCGSRSLAFPFSLARGRALNLHPRLPPRRSLHTVHAPHGRMRSPTPVDPTPTPHPSPTPPRRAA
jgi:hypothetical protein